MKFFAFFMAFLVLGLSCLPCADGPFAMDIGKVKTEVSKASTHQHDTDQTDECSPFCHCSCCAGFSVNHTLTPIFNPLIFGNRELVSFLPANLLEISLPIWQPPQLS